MKSRPAIIVLAAGQGPRFAGLQQRSTQEWGAPSVLAATLSEALATRLRVVVVTTELLADAVGRQVATRDIVVLPAAGSPAHRGLGHSMAAGVAARSHAAGWLMLPAHMPQVRAATLLAVAHELGTHPVAYAQYQGLRGHPVGYAAELYSELVMLTSDEGARRLVARYPAHGVEVDDPGALPAEGDEGHGEGHRAPAQGPAATVPPRRL